MSLVIVSEDYQKSFTISYLGFTEMRKGFLLSYSKKVYDMYILMLKCYMNNDWESVNNIDRLLQIYIPNDLLILINHSDVDGILNPFECKRLIKYLDIDISLVKNEMNPNVIYPMMEFKEMVKYSIDNDVKLLFE